MSKTFFCVENLLSNIALRINTQLYSSVISRASVRQLVFTYVLYFYVQTISFHLRHNYDVYDVAIINYVQDVCYYRMDL